jgi:hypothetical protein
MLIGRCIKWQKAEVVAYRGLVLHLNRAPRIVWVSVQHDAKYRIMRRIFLACKHAAQMRSVFTQQKFHKGRHFVAIIFAPVNIRHKHAFVVRGRLMLIIQKVFHVKNCMHYLRASV